MPVFAASDGTLFEDRNAWRKYEFKLRYTFENKIGEKLVRNPGEINAQPFDIAQLQDCEVLLLDHTDQIQIDLLTRCRVFVGACATSVFVRDCNDCEFTVATRQFRARGCHRCTFHLYSMTQPIIELSSEVVFTPFNGAYPQLEQHLGSARLDVKENHWNLVFDFNDTEQSGRNFSVVYGMSSIPLWQPLEPAESPIPLSASVPAPAASSTQSMATFSFDVSQAEAERILQEAQVNVPPAVPASASIAVPSNVHPLPPPPPYTETGAPLELSAADQQCAPGSETLGNAAEMAVNVAQLLESISTRYGQEEVTVDATQADAVVDVLST